MNDLIDFFKQNRIEGCYLLLVLALRIIWDWKKTSKFQKIQDFFAGGILAFLLGKICDGWGIEGSDRDLIVWSFAFLGMKGLDFIYVKAMSLLEKKTQI